MCLIASFFWYWWFQVLIISKCMHCLPACFFKCITVSAFMLCMVKMPLKGVVLGCALNGHGNYEGRFYVCRMVDLMKTAKVNAYIMHTRGDQKVRGKVLLNRIAFIDCNENS